MKKIVAFCLVWLMVVSLCACGTQAEVEYSVEIDGITYSAGSEEELEQIIYEQTIGQLEGLFDSESGVKENVTMIEVVDCGYEELSGEYHMFYFKIKNISDMDVNTVTININILDENGDIVDATYPQEPATVKPGQAIIIDALTKDERGAVAAVVDSYNLYDENDNYCMGSIDNCPIVEFTP